MATRFYSSVEYGGQRNSTDADCVYYNATVINNSTVDPLGYAPDPQVSFNEVRQTPIIQNPADYMATVVKLSSTGATKNLPLWIPRIQTNSVVGTIKGSIAGTVLTVTDSNGTYIALNKPDILLSLGGAETPISGCYVVSQILSSNPPQYNLSIAPVTQSPGTFTGIISFVQQQTDPDLTVYSVTVQNNTGGLSQVYLRWQPENLYAISPPSPVVTQFLNTDYYYSYTYQTMLDMINTALAAASTVVGISTPPVMKWDNGQLSPGTFTGSSSRTDPPTFTLVGSSGANVFLNSALEALVGNFYGAFTNLDNGRTFLFSYTEGLVSSQQYPSVSSWSPVENLTVTSSLLPLVMEQCPPPGAVGSSSINSLGHVVGGSFLPILIDDIPAITAPSDWRQQILYQATGEYRMVSLTSTNSPIQNIDIQVWWRNRLDNQLYPLRLVSGSSITIKLLFRRKQMGV
jgi:hypothetical protein